MRKLTITDLYHTDRVKVIRAAAIARAGGNSGVVVTDDGSWQVYDLRNDLAKARFAALTERSPDFLIGVYGATEECADITQMVIDDLVLMGAV